MPPVSLPGCDKPYRPIRLPPSPGSAVFLPAASGGAWLLPRRRGRGRRSRRRCAGDRRSCGGPPAAARRRRAAGPRPRRGGWRSARRTGRAAACCGSPERSADAADCRSSRIAARSSRSRVCASDWRIAAMSSSVACSAASRAISGSRIRRARITSDGLERAGDVGDRDRLARSAGCRRRCPCRRAARCGRRLQHRERLAQVAARDAEDLAELALRRQPAVGRQIELREIGLELHQRRVPPSPAGSSNGLTNSLIILVARAGHNRIDASGQSTAQDLSV